MTTNDLPTALQRFAAAAAQELRAPYTVGAHASMTALLGVTPWLASLGPITADNEPHPVALAFVGLLAELNKPRGDHEATVVDFLDICNGLRSASSKLLDARAHPQDYAPSDIHRVHVERERLLSRLEAYAAG